MVNNKSAARKLNCFNANRTSLPLSDGGAGVSSLSLPMGRSLEDDAPAPLLKMSFHRPLICPFCSCRCRWTGLGPELMLLEAAAAEGFLRLMMEIGIWPGCSIGGRATTAPEEDDDED